MKAQSERKSDVQINCINIMTKNKQSSSCIFHQVVHYLFVDPFMHVVKIHSHHFDTYLSFENVCIFRLYFVLLCSKCSAFISLRKEKLCIAMFIMRWSQRLHKSIRMIEQIGFDFKVQAISLEMNRNELIFELYIDPFLKFFFYYFVPFFSLLDFRIRIYFGLCTQSAFYWVLNISERKTETK